MPHSVSRADVVRELIWAIRKALSRKPLGGESSPVMDCKSLGEGAFGFALRGYVHVLERGSRERVRWLVIKGPLPAPGDAGEYKVENDYLCWEHSSRAAIGVVPGLSAAPRRIDIDAADFEGYLETKVARVLQLPTRVTLLVFTRAERMVHVPPVALSDLARRPATTARDLFNWCELARTLGSSIPQMHKHLWIHRDIKLANVIAQESDGFLRSIEVIDFGTATRFHSPEGDPIALGASLNVGTRSYYRPKRARPGYVPRSAIDEDIYAFASLLGRVLLGATDDDPADKIEQRVHATAIRLADRDDQLSEHLGEAYGLVHQLLVEEHADSFAAVADLLTRIEHLRTATLGLIARGSRPTLRRLGLRKPSREGPIDLDASIVHPGPDLSLIAGLLESLEVCATSVDEERWCQRYVDDDIERVAAELKITRGHRFEIGLRDCVTLLRHGYVRLAERGLDRLLAGPSGSPADDARALRLHVGLLLLREHRTAEARQVLQRFTAFLPQEEDESFDGSVVPDAPAILSHEEILGLHDAARTIGLSREALLAGIDVGFRSVLPPAATPSDQILQDLDTLNRAGSLSDRSVPLAIWLSNAVALSGKRRGAAVFEATLLRCREKLRAPVRLRWWVAMLLARVRLEEGLPVDPAKLEVEDLDERQQVWLIALRVLSALHGKKPIDPELHAGLRLFIRRMASTPELLFAIIQIARSFAQRHDLAMAFRWLHAGVGEATARAFPLEYATLLSTAARLTLAAKRNEAQRGALAAGGVDVDSLAQTAERLAVHAADIFDRLGVPALREGAVGVAARCAMEPTFTGIVTAARWTELKAANLSLVDPAARPSRLDDLPDLRHFWGSSASDPGTTEARIFYNRYGHYIEQLWGTGALSIERLEGRTPSIEATLAALLPPAGSGVVPQHVLVIGCGMGGEVFALARRYPFAEIHGVDASSWYVDAAWQRRAAEPPDIQRRCTFQCADVGEGVSLGPHDGEPGAWDLVVMRETLAHVTFKRSFLAYLQRKLKPDAELWVTDLVQGRPCGPSEWRTILESVAVTNLPSTAGLVEDFRATAFTVTSGPVDHTPDLVEFLANRLDWFNNKETEAARSLHASLLVARKITRLLGVLHDASRRGVLGWTWLSARATPGESPPVSERLPPSVRLRPRSKFPRYA